MRVNYKLFKIELKVSYKSFTSELKINCKLFKMSWKLIINCLKTNLKLTINYLTMTYELTINELQNHRWKFIWTNSIHHGTMSNINVHNTNNVIICEAPLVINLIHNDILINLNDQIHTPWSQVHNFKPHENNTQMLILNYWVTFCCTRMRRVNGSTKKTLKRLASWKFVNTSIICILFSIYRADFYQWNDVICARNFEELGNSKSYNLLKLVSTFGLMNVGGHFHPLLHQVASTCSNELLLTHEFSLQCLTSRA